jgi:hypothetical protein
MYDPAGVKPAHSQTPSLSHASLIGAMFAGGRRLSGFRDSILTTAIPDTFIGRPYYPA